MNRLISRIAALLWLLAACASAEPLPVMLLDFSQENPSQWQSALPFIRPLRGTQGLEIPLDFTEPNRQRLAARAGQWNLEPYSSFRFRVAVQSSANLLECSLRLRSGDGVYTHSFTLPEEGMQHVLLVKADFQTEGKPAGWNRIDEIRLTFWPRGTGRAKLLPVSLEGFRDRLWLIDTESLARTPDETYTARVTLRHLERLLRELGVPHGRAPISAPPPSAQAGLLLIPYLPRLPDAETRALFRLLDGGTKLIVFESDHAGLAARMGVTLGDAVSSDTVGRFHHLVMRQDLFPELPREIHQHAWSFRKIRPKEGARAIATWHDERNQSVGEVGAVLHANGLWLNVAWRSGDVGAKRQALVEWLGQLSPGLLRESLRFHAECQSPDQFLRRHGVIGDTPAAARLAAAAQRAYEEAVSLRGQPDPRPALRRFLQSRHWMWRSLAAGQAPWPAKVRGIWDQQGTGFAAGSWDRTCRELRAAGFNAVFANFASAGRAHYPSKLIPPSKTLEQHGDQLRAFSEAARSAGLQAHAWRICWKLNTRLPAFAARLEREGRLMADQEGRTLPWLSPSHPANLRHEIDSILEMARHAPLDGIHLDYMRYPGREADYGPAARKAFEQKIGRALPQWPREVLGPLRQEFQQFRQQEIHRAMEQISAAVRREFPGMILSVAVWGAWPDCADAQAQDWPKWAERGWVDWIIPMNYTDNPDQFAGWLDLQRAQPGVAERLVPGVGLISTNAELDPAQLLRQLQLIRERNLPGAVIYRLDSSLKERIFPYLRLWQD